MKGFVYFLSNPKEGTTKIGYTTKNPHKRIRAIVTQSGNLELVLTGYVYSTNARQLEGELHKYWNHCRIPNTEWFELDSRDAYDKAIELT